MLELQSITLNLGGKFRMLFGVSDRAVSTFEKRPTPLHALNVTQTPLVRCKTIESNHRNGT